MFPFSPTTTYTSPPSRNHQRSLILKPLKAFLSSKHPTTPTTRPSPSNTIHQRRPSLLGVLLLHRGAIRHKLGVVLLPLGVLERPFMSARAALPDTEKDE